LAGMIHVSEPSELARAAEELASRGVYGMLISGGFTRDGKLPVEPYIPVLKMIKRRLNLILSIHPGFISVETMEALRDAGVDIVDYELSLDNYTLKVLRHLNISVEDHVKHYKLLLEHGPRYIVPHIPIGFTESDEWIINAINLLKESEPEILVFLVNMASGVEIVDRVVRVLEVARSKLSSEISLGCMRPHSIKRVLDEVVVKKELVDRIVNPHREVLDRYGLSVVEACCSIPRAILKTLYSDPSSSLRRDS